MPDAENMSNMTVPGGYNLVVPPGWDWIPLREGTDEAVKRVVDRAVHQLPDDIPRDDISAARMELLKHFRGAVRRARDAAGLMLYLPVEKMHGTLIPASFVTSEIPFATTEGQADVEPGLVTTQLLADLQPGEPVSVDDALGVRTDRVVAPDMEQDVEYSSRRIEYVLAVPDDPGGRWLTICFSTIGDGDPRSEFSEVLVELFDSVMTTFRWSRT